MKVVLLQDVPKVGRKGEVKEISDGFARNALIPQKKAVLATSASIKRVEALKSREHEVHTAREGELAACAASFADAPLAIIHAANEDGTLFAAVSKEELARAILARCSISVSSDDLTIDTPIKTIGEHTITLAGNAIPVTVAAEE